jgi:hypothetical protein
LLLVALGRFLVAFVMLLVALGMLLAALEMLLVAFSVLLAEFWVLLVEHQVSQKWNLEKFPACRVNWDGRGGIGRGSWEPAGCAGLNHQEEIHHADHGH